MFKRYTYIVLLLSVGLLASCNAIMDDANCSSEGGVVRNITFTIAMENADRATRAAWNEDYTAEAALAFDSRIAYDGLQVQFYTAQNNYIGELKNVMYWQDGDNGYIVSGNVTDLNMVEGESYKIMVFANCPDATSPENLVYELSSINYPSGYIPMWGVKTFEVEGGERQDLGVIDLLRSMAKVEVQLTNEMVANGFELTAASLNHHNTEGYCLPTGWSDAASTGEIDQEECMNAVHSHSAQPLNMYEYEQGRKYVIYIPEFNVLHTAINRPNLSVTLNDGAGVLEFPNAIHFGKYDSNGDLIDDSEANIVRNHIYRFNIAGVSSGIELEYEVLDWEDGGTWDRGEFAYPTYHNPVVPDYTKPEDIITTAPVMSYNAVNSEENAFSVWFRLTRPIGQVWTPTVHGSDTDYMIKVYKNGLELTDPETWVASDEWYNIKLIPMNPENSGVVVDFGITYTQDWMPDGTSHYLLINGKNNEIAWPDSGDEPEIIKVKQL